MKKFFMVSALLIMFFAVSCGSSGSSGNKDNADETVTDSDTADSGQDDTTPEQPDDEDSGRKQGELYGECYPNATCNQGLICDEENNVCIKDPDGGGDSDSDVSDSTPDDGDSDTSDSTDDTDSYTSDSADDSADTSDSQSDNDADTDSGEAEEHCETVDAKLWWSPKSADTMGWLSALNYCEKELNDLNKCGYSDWHLPTIDELKALLKWRRDSQCKVSDTGNCLYSDAAKGCWTCSSCCHDCTLGGGGECNLSSYYYDGRYSKLGDSGSLWSSSVPTEYTTLAWAVDFNAAQVYIKPKSNGVYVRCVR